jgi:CheY-like chemotaxis protein
MNGLEATRKIRQAQDARYPPVIIGISAHALDHHREKALAAGMDLYMPKPIRPSTLLRELRLRLGLP